MTKKQKQNHPIPDSIKIGYVDYQFDFWPDTFASTEEAQGEFFATHGKIGLKSSALESVHGTNTVLHEILHAIVYQYGLVETLGDKEEVVVNTMANGLSTVFVDNPWFIDYIKKYQKIGQSE
jgi:hypothetical protein|tara:strand:- start:312 stop:677 length:366 start_codon:yes stop_codon:yes gene_type:complete